MDWIQSCEEQESFDSEKYKVIKAEEPSLEKQRIFSVSYIVFNGMNLERSRVMTQNYLNPFGIMLVAIKVANELSESDSKELSKYNFDNIDPLMKLKNYGKRHIIQ